MPYKDLEKKREHNRRYFSDWYQSNKEKVLKSNREYKKKKRKEWAEFKSSFSCVNCKINHPAVIDFHHIGEKEKAVSKFIQDGQYSKAYKELDKCIPICSNCHRILHWEKINLGDKSDITKQNDQKVS